MLHVYLCVCAVAFHASDTAQAQNQVSVSKCGKWVVFSSGSGTVVFGDSKTVFEQDDAVGAFFHSLNGGDETLWVFFETGEIQQLRVGSWEVVDQHRIDGTAFEHDLFTFSLGYAAFLAGTDTAILEVNPTGSVILFDLSEKKATALNWYGDDCVLKIQPVNRRMEKGEVATSYDWRLEEVAVVESNQLLFELNGKDGRTRRLELRDRETFEFIELLPPDFSALPARYTKRGRYFRLSNDLDTLELYDQNCDLPKTPVLTIQMRDIWVPSLDLQCFDETGFLFFRQNDRLQTILSRDLNANGETMERRIPNLYHFEAESPESAIVILWNKRFLNEFAAIRLSGKSLELTRQWGNENLADQATATKSSIATKSGKQQSEKRSVKTD
jgi:hypothetical protein